MSMPRCRMMSIKRRAHSREFGCRAVPRALEQKIKLFKVDDSIVKISGKVTNITVNNCNRVGILYVVREPSAPRASRSLTRSLSLGAASRT